jgi:hypothetical protein
VPAFLALNGGAVLAAFAAASALGMRVRPSALLLATLAGYLVVVHSAVLAAGVAGHLTVSGLAVVVGVLLALSLSRLRRGRDDGADRRTTTHKRFGVIAVVAPAIAIGSAAVAAWPHLVQATRLWVWDDYTYHMVYPTLWLREHAITALTPPQTFTMQAWYPLSASLVAAWYMAPFFGSRADALAWVSLTGVLYGAIVAAGVGEVLARLGCRRGAWAVPVVLLVTSGRIDVMASSFSDADLAVAAALFAALVFAIPRGDVEARADVMVDAGYAALLSGIALGVKVSAAPVALIALGTVAWRIGGVRAAARVATVFAAGWAVTCGYWYARNVLHTGNPVYPAAFFVWPGVTFPETTLLEYWRRYGAERAGRDALGVYANWPRAHAALATLGVVALTVWSVLRWRLTPATRRTFACVVLLVIVTMLALLPAAPYSAGNAMTFRSGFVHWDSMRYVALVPLLGWTALGFVIDAGAGARWWRTASAILVAAVAVAASTLSTIAIALVALGAGVTLHVCTRPRWAPRPAGRRAVVAAVVAVVVAGFVVLVHGRKSAATGAALVAEPLFGGALGALAAVPPGTRVAVFGDQWVYPAFGPRHDLDPVRLDRDGRLASAPIGAEMAPAGVTVDPATLRANLRAARIGFVVVVHQPHPGRAPAWPAQHAAIEAAGDARLIHRDAASAVWKLD